MLIAIIFRYLGTILQFIVLAVIARSTSSDDYGLYVLCLSFAYSFYYILGFGASESALARLARDLAAGRDEQVGLCVGTVLGLLGICAILALFLPLGIGLIQSMPTESNMAIIFTLVFLSANGIVFNIAQILLGLRRVKLGTFFFYPAINLMLLLTTVPAVLLLPNPNFLHLSIASGSAAIFTSLVAILICIVSMRNISLECSVRFGCKLIKEGFGLSCLRILHVSSFWIPTMVSGFLLSPALAGAMGTAGRLAIAVSAVIAATRFFIRPIINEALELNQIHYLRRLMSSIAFLTMLIAVVALFVNELVGEELIAYFFGEELREVAALFSILLLGVIAEAIFGPIDEFLKAAGYQRKVGIIYGVAVPLFLVGSILVARFGLAWIAWLQVVYVMGVFIAMNLLVRKKFGFVILPSLPTLNELRKLK